MSTPPSPMGTGPAATRPATVAVVGVGAVGATLAGLLAAAGHPVLACSPHRPADDALVLESPAGRSTHPVRWAATAGEVDRTVDWVVVATKIPQTAAAGPWLAALSGPATRVLVAQNGVDQTVRFAALTDRPVVPALVYLQAERTGVGHVHFRRTARDLVVPDDPAGRAAKALFAGTPLTVELAPDFRTAAWEKLLRNSAANPIPALTDRRMDVFADAEVMSLARDVLTETAAVARAEGARLPGDAVEAAMDWLRSLHPDAVTSMLQDRRAGRQTEIDGLLGTTVTLAARHGLTVPTTRSLRALLRAAERPSPADAGTCAPAARLAPAPRRPDDRPGARGASGRPA